VKAAIKTLNGRRTTILRMRQDYLRDISEYADLIAGREHAIADIEAERDEIDSALLALGGDIEEAERE
jgi:hypothetical protein